MKGLIRGIKILLTIAVICVTFILAGQPVVADKAYKAVQKPEYGTLSNGKTGYYIKDDVLYKYNYKNKKAKQLKKLNKKLGLYISAVYGKNIYMTSSDFDKWSLKTYIYNTKNKKVKYSKVKSSIIDTNGQYAITQDEFRSDVSPYKMSLYKLTNSGMKKVKTLSQHGMSVHFIKDKIYYTNYPLDGKDDGAGMSKIEIYACNKDGSNPEILGEMTDSAEFGVIYVIEMKEDYCDVMMSDDRDYRYTFATKQLEKLEK